MKILIIMMKMMIMIIFVQNKINDLGNRNNNLLYNHRKVQFQIQMINKIKIKIKIRRNNLIISPDQ